MILSFMIIKCSLDFFIKLNSVLEHDTLSLFNMEALKPPSTGPKLRVKMVNVARTGDTESKV